MFSSAMKNDLQWIRKALMVLVTFNDPVPIFQCYRGHTTAMSGVCSQWCHADSPVHSIVPFPALPHSDNDGMVISFENIVWVSILLCTDAVKIICICLVKRKRRESKTFVCCMKALSPPYRYISLDSDTMCKINLSSISFCLQET